MKEESFSVASVQTDRADVDVIFFRDAEDFPFVFGNSRVAGVRGERQTGVAFDCLTKFVDGNFQIARRRNFFQFSLARIKFVFQSGRRTRSTKTERRRFKAETAQQKKCERHPDEKNEKCFKPEQTGAALRSILRKIIHSERRAAS